jgi:hypothetical protein
MFQKNKFCLETEDREYLELLYALFIDRWWIIIDNSVVVVVGRRHLQRIIWSRTKAF